MQTSLIKMPIEIESEAITNRTKLNVTFDVEKQKPQIQIKNATFDMTDGQNEELNLNSRNYLRQITYNIPSHNSFLKNLNVDKGMNDPDFLVPTLDHLDDVQELARLQEESKQVITTDDEYLVHILKA